MFALAAWLLRHLCLTPWFLGALCLALASAGWASVHPLDHYLRHYKRFDLSNAARVAFGSAVIVTVSSVLLFFRLLSLSDLSCQHSSIIKPGMLPPPPIPTKNDSAAQPERKLLPPPKKDESYLETLDWQQWHATIWNTMFLNLAFPFPIGTSADFSFDISSNGSISNINVESDNTLYRQYVESRIEMLRSSDVLRFPAGSQRDTVSYKARIKVCDLSDLSDPNHLTCGKPSVGKKDNETIRRAR
jgi:hypothetical protein